MVGNHLTEKKSGSTGQWLLSQKFRNYLIGFSFPVALVLGTAGYLQYGNESEPVSFSNALYHSAQLFILHSPHFDKPVPWELEAGRWMAALSTIIFVISTIFQLFHQEKLNLKLKLMNNHIIICGIGETGIRIIEKVAAKGVKVVAIDKNPETEIAERLKSLHIPLITGDAERSEMLTEARIRHAKRIYALCKEDATNCNIAVQTFELSGKALNPPDCVVQINDHDLRNSLQKMMRGPIMKSKLNIHFVDFYLPEAFHLIVHGLPLDHEGISAHDERGVHLVIIGFGRMGRTIAETAAQLGHFANNKPLIISVIDRDSNKNRDTLLFHHPYFEKAALVRFYHQEIRSVETLQLVEKWCDETDKLVNIVVCFDNQPLALNIVLTFTRFLYKENVRIAARMENSSARVLDLGPGLILQKKVITFGYDKGILNLIDPHDSDIEKYASGIHEAFVSFKTNQLKNDPEALEKALQSGSLNKWEALNEDFRESNRQQALHMYIKIRSLNCEIVYLHDSGPPIESFSSNDLESLAELEHTRWMAERYVNNWQYGKEKNTERKISPYLVPWEQLPEDIKNYDRDIVRMMPDLLRSIGKKIVRK